MTSISSTESPSCFQGIDAALIVDWEQSSLSLPGSGANVSVCDVLVASNGCRVSADRL